MGVEGQVNTWITKAFQQGASDLHFEPEKGDKVRVRMRLDGQLKLLETSAGGKQILSRIKVMAELDINEKAIPQDGRINAIQHIPGCPGLDIRLSTLPCLNGEKAVLRLIDSRRLNMKLDQLGFTKKMLALYEPMVASPFGLILHVGPTGSGKTTSLYSVIQTLKKGDINIQTVENPIEYQVFGITQTQVNPEYGLTFPVVLRALLRQDPDVILVGEIRDHETADIAIEAAMTGHLVLSTLHTNDAVGTVVRLLDMGIAPYGIAYALRCVISQRFVRRLCTKCRRGIQPPERVVRVTGSRRQIYQASGCASCAKTGYKGRIPLFEYMPNSPALRKAVYQTVTPDSLAAVAAKNGLVSLWDDGMDKVWQGETSLDEVLRATQGASKTKPKPKPTPKPKPKPQLRRPSSSSWCESGARRVAPPPRRPR